MTTNTSNSSSASDSSGAHDRLATVPDLSEARRFIESLTGDASAIVTFQTFDDSEEKRGRLAHVFHGRLDEGVDALTKLNQQRAGVFIMINAGDGIVHKGEKTCRTTANVTRVRALFVDLDGAPLQALTDAGAPPDVIVNSSPEKYHGYWLGVSCPLDAFPPTQLALAEKFGGDPSVHDLPRVMRLPGFFHQKTEPFMTRIIKP